MIGLVLDRYPEFRIRLVLDLDSKRGVPADGTDTCEGRDGLS